MDLHDDTRCQFFDSINVNPSFLEDGVKNWQRHQTFASSQMRVRKLLTSCQKTHYSIYGTVLTMRAKVGKDKTKLTNWKVVSDLSELVRFTYHFGAIANQNSFNKWLRVEHCMYLLKFTFIGFQNFTRSVINNHSCLSHIFFKDWVVLGKAATFTKNTSKGKFLF